MSADWKPTDGVLDRGSGPPAATARPADGGLVMLDLLATSERLGTALARALTAGQWLDAYLLSAGMQQMVEDRLHPDPLQLRRGARYLHGGGHWARSAATALDATAATVGLFGRSPRGQQRLVDARHSMAQLTATLAGLVQDPRAVVPDPGGVQRMAARAEACAAVAPGDVVRLPTCFRSFDLHPDDVCWLSRAYVERYGPPSAPTCVVGVRTSGSYLAPLHAASLRATGATRVDVLTYRPGRPFRAPERTILRAVAHAGGRVMVTDDPPGTGSALADTVAAITEAGVPRDKVTLVLSLFTDDPALPARLEGCPAVLQLWPDLSVQGRLDEASVGRELARMLTPRWRVDSCRRLCRSTTQSARRHQWGRYAVELTDLDSGAHDRRDVAVEGAGLGYLGRHAVGVAEALDGWTPRIYGFADGLLYREWLPDATDPMDEATAVDIVAGYASQRRRALPATADPTARMRGRDPVWEVAAELLGRVYGPLAPAARAYLLDSLTRRLLQPQRASVVDGATDLSRWFPHPVHPGRWVKVDFHQRAFSNLELACYDAALDLAGAVGDPPSSGFGRELRAAFHEASGELVDGERWLLYRLAQLWRAGKAGDIDASTVARRSADAVHDYLADCHLRDVPPSDGPLCAIDLDGVLESDRLGYPASGPTGTLALRALVTHGYRPVLATGRSLADARDRCAVFGLAGAVAEYGSVIHDQPRDTSIDLRTQSERDLIDRAGGALARQGLEVDPGHQHCVRVRLHGGRLPSEVVRATPILQDPRLRIVHGQGQSDVTIRRLDKVVGLRALAQWLGAEECALAVGDSASDLSMLATARLARAPRNADRSVRRAGVPRTRGAYQAGLAEACTALLGHRPGACPVCTTRVLPHRTSELLGVLALSEGGLRGLPSRTLRLALLVAAGRWRGSQVIG